MTGECTASPSSRLTLFNLRKHIASVSEEETPQCLKVSVTGSAFHHFLHPPGSWLSLYLCHIDSSRIFILSSSNLKPQNTISKIPLTFLLFHLISGFCHIFHKKLFFLCSLASYQLAYTKNFSTFPNIFAKCCCMDHTFHLVWARHFILESFLFCLSKALQSVDYFPIISPFCGCFLLWFEFKLKFNYHFNSVKRWNL